MKVGKNKLASHFLEDTYLIGRIIEIHFLEILPKDLSGRSKSSSNVTSFRIGRF